MSTISPGKKERDISINLNCYTIRFRKKGDKKNFYSYKDVFGALSFKDLLQRFINTIDKGHYKNKLEDRILYLKELIKLSGSTVSGIIRKGHSGHETYIDAVVNNAPVTKNTVGSDQFNSSPFYFLLSLPKTDGKCMIFIAQSYKQFGFKEVFEEAFIEFFKANFGEDFICEFGTLSIASLFKKYVSDGNIRKLRLRKHKLTPQLESFVQGEDTEVNPEDFEVEMSIKAKRKTRYNFFNHMKDINLEETSFVETFKVDGYDYDEALVEVTTNGRSRVLNFSDPESFAASYDVTKKVGVDAKTKHPNFDKLNDEAISILNDELIPNVRQ